MNKQELIAAIAENSNLTKADTTRALDALIDTVQTTLQKGESIVLVGFGTFDVKERPERSGRNPRSGEAVTIPAAKVPHFKAGKTLKDTVNS